MGSVKPIAGNMAMVAVACGLAYGSRHAIRHVAGVSQEMLANAVVAQVGLGSLVAMKAVQQKSALDQRIAEVTRLTQEREEARTQAAGLQTDLTTANRERDRIRGEAGQAAGLSNQLDQAWIDLTRVRQEAATAQGEVRVKEEELQRLRAERDGLSAELQIARGESRALTDRAGRVAGMERELARVTRALAAAEGQREEHRGELRSAWEDKYRRLEEGHEQRMGALVGEHQRALDALREQYRQEISLLQGRHGEGMEALQRQHQEGLSEAQRSLREELEASHSREVKQLVAEHQRALDALGEQYRQESTAQQAAQPADSPPPPPPLPPPPPAIGPSPTVNSAGRRERSEEHPPRPDFLGAPAGHQSRERGVAPRAPENSPNLAPNDRLKQEIVEGIRLRETQAGSATQEWIKRKPNISDPSDVGACLHAALSNRFASLNPRENEAQDRMTLADLTDKLQWEQVKNAEGRMVDVPNAVIDYLENMSVADARSLMDWVNRQNVKDEKAMKEIYQYIVNVTVVLYQANKNKIDMTASIVQFGNPTGLLSGMDFQKLMADFQNQ